MDATTLTLADRIHRERTAALYRDHERRRTVADRGVGITPARPEVHAHAGLGVWLREHFAAPRRPRFS
ncbi:hypothetical protein JNB62_04675 [Microbacterium jejuense]|uniref:Uncharacterized protein n=1 Tax=Microbacterium jejuense TaxID=1263637 RepID=A0ABS7HJ43_9MICO|nr:hypothetical protein [Microbacterium jejuense]MBW9092971.1 hypothetical protein [Microbacterium jejuense]